MKKLIYLATAAALLSSAGAYANTEANINDITSGYDQEDESESIEVFRGRTRPPRRKRPRYEGRLVRGEWKDAWYPTLNESLSASKLLGHKETQIEGLCPGYNANDLKRRTFWQQLMIALSWIESLHGPRNYVRFNGGTNNGLFQINPVLRPAYGCNGYDLFSATDNIKCAIKMADHLVKRFGSFLQGSKGGMAAYWQPLRSTSRYNRKNRAFILASTTKACRTGQIEHFSRNDFIPMVNPNTLEDLGVEQWMLDTLDLSVYDAPTFEE